jgi:hypothetical protein
LRLIKQEKKMKIVESTSANPSVSDTLTPTEPAVNGLVYCPLCTHSVGAKIQRVKKVWKVVAKQPCPRCHSALDAAFVIRAELN